MSQRPLIVVLDDLENAARQCADWSALERSAELRFVQTALQGPHLLEVIQPAQALVLMRDRTALPADLIARLPNLKYVVFTGNRSEAVDLAALRSRNIPVSCTRFGPSRINACEQAWALILAAVKRLPQNDRALRQGQWREAHVLPTLLHGQRMGLIGLGDIGSRMDVVAQAFGMEVVVWSPHMSMTRAAARDATAVPLDELLQTSKVVSVHLVASAQTHHLFNAERFAQMRSDSVFVNTSHPALVDESALIAALKSGKPGAAALDVYSNEPLPPDSELLKAPNLVLSPHLGFVCKEVLEQFYADVAESLQAWIDGQALLREVWPLQAN